MGAWAKVAPFGLDGGAPGALGRNWVERAASGGAAEPPTVEVLGHRGTAELQPGDTFVILTPGGGGYGAPAAASN